ncbi:MAG: L,D-transpeptidase family protein [Beijerinckiaceae bacterium]|nr:L,D-transpeptidase family protein [Beijerinckiaceae bacterium]
MRGRLRSIVFTGAATAALLYGFAMPANAAAGLPPAGPLEIPAASEAPRKSAPLAVPAEHPEASAPIPSVSDAAKATAVPRAGEETSASAKAAEPQSSATVGNAETTKPEAGKTGAANTGIDPEPDVAITPPPVAPESRPASTVNPLDAAKAASVPLPPLDSAIKTALEKREAAEIRGAGAAQRRKQRDSIAAFYAARSFAPVWSANGAAVTAVGPVIERLAHAADDALTLPSAPASLNVSGTMDEQAESELALSEAVALFAAEATGSRIDPRSIAPLIGFKPAIADAADVLKAVAEAGSDAGDRLEAFNPAEPRYGALRKKLAELRAVHASPVPVAAIPDGPVLRIGMNDPRVPLIRARFSLDGTPDSAPQKLRYDTEVAAAVAGFQKANGLPASGVLTRRTIAALSGGKPSRLEAQLVANMEMWRWMPRDLGADRIEVNVPDYLVTVYRGGAAVSTNRVVVGKTATPTPLFSNSMKFLIVNPVWNVPESIIKKEMLPRLAEDPGYLGAHGYTAAYRNGRLVVKQPAGAKNALGRIKFMFPNDYAVYLHDTPSKALFASAQRAFSHGCVRVDQPFRFAENVLGQGNGWSQKRLLAMLGDSERYVNLPAPLPIHIEYFTASVDEAGHLDLRDDVYDYVHRVAIALGQEG